MEGEKMSPADGATLPSYGGTCRVGGKYSVPTWTPYQLWSIRYLVQEDCRPVRGSSHSGSALGGFWGV